MEYKISKTWNTIDKYPKHGIQLIISKTWYAIDKYPKHGIQISKTWNTKYPKHGILRREPEQIVQKTSMASL